MIVTDIQTDRFVLRAPHAHDAPALAEMMTPAVSRWLGSWHTPFTPAMAVDRIASASLAETEKTGLSRVIERRTDTAVLGWIGVWRLTKDSRRAVLSYWLGEAHHGSRTMQEVASTMIALAFDAWDIDALEASTHPENLVSAAVLRRCGMRLVGERSIFAPARAREELCLIFETPCPTG